MKKIMMMLLIATVAMTASAQNTLRDKSSFTLQPKVGLGLASFSGSWEGGGDYKMKVGFVAGVEGEYYVNDWFSTALGVNYAQQGWKFENGGVKTTTKLDFINVPLIANFYVAKGLALKTGVQFGFLTTAKYGDTKNKDEFNSFNFAIPVGISYEYADFVLDLRYNIALSAINKNSSSDNKYRSDLIQITVGYKIDL
jgi:hypothetical protein